MIETGTLLEKQREELGLSIAEVSRSLKINTKTIQKIEAGLIDEMPNKPFVRGFVKSYASFLKLDTASVLDMLDLELGGAGKNKDIEEKTHNSNSWFRKVKTSKKPRSKKLLVFLIFSVIALLLANSTYKYLNDSAFMGGTSAKKKVEIKIPDKQLSIGEQSPPKINPEVIYPVLSTKKKAIPIKQITDELKTADPKKRPSYTDLAGNKISITRPILLSPPIPLAGPLATPVVPLKAKVTKADSTKKPALEKKEKTKKKVVAKVAPAKISKKAPLFKQELRLYASKTTNIVFQIDKDIKRNISLGKGQTHRLKAFDKIWLSIEDAGNIFIFQNNNDLGKAGKSGESKELVFE